MTVHALQTNFTDREGYIRWRKTWRTTYRVVSERIRHRKQLIKEMSREGNPLVGKHQKEIHLMTADARKMMTLLGDATERRDRILAMHKQIKDQNATFPLVISARVADFSYNRVHNEFAFMPRWLIRASGRTLYVDHIDAQMGFETRELDDGNTRGMLRFRACDISISADGIAKVTKRAEIAMAA